MDIKQMSWLVTSNSKSFVCLTPCHISTHVANYDKGFPSGRLPEAPVGWPVGSPPPRLLIMTVATHREPFIDLVEHSVEQLGSEFLLHVVGVGGVFTG